MFSVPKLPGWPCGPPSLQLMGLCGGEGGKSSSCDVKLTTQHLVLIIGMSGTINLLKQRDSFTYQQV